MTLFLSYFLLAEPSSHPLLPGRIFLRLPPSPTRSPRLSALIRAVSDKDAGGLTQAVGLARVRLLLLQGNRPAARIEATSLVYRFRDEALMSLAFAEVAAGDVDTALTTAALVDGGYSHLKLTVIRPDGRQNYVVGLTPAVIGALWPQLR